MSRLLYDENNLPDISTLKAANYDNIDLNEVGKRAMWMLTDLLNGDLVEHSARFDAILSRGDSTINMSGNDVDYH